MNNGLLKRMIFCLLVSAPVLAFIIAQFSFGYICIPSIIIIFIIIGIFILNIFPRETFIRNTNKKYKLDIDMALPTNGGVKFSHTKADVKLNLSEFTPQRRKTMIISIIACVLMLSIAFMVYYFFAQKVYDSGAKLVDATVISVVDKSKTEVEHNGIRETSTTTYACDVTFSYTLNEETHEITHCFQNMSSFEATNLQIYVKDGKFIATAKQPNTALIFTIYYVLLAIIHFIRIFFASDIPSAIFGAIFSSTLGLLLIPLSVSFMQLLFTPFSSIVLLLSICGVLFLFATKPSINLYSIKQRTITTGIGTGM